MIDGKWTASESGQDEHLYYTIRDTGGNIVCFGGTYLDEPGGRRMPTTTVRAHMRLLQAAPEMFRALEAARRLLDGHSQFRPSEVWEMVKAAMDKAQRGE